jgi:excisionase family DNA binding protein
VSGIYLLPHVFFPEAFGPTLVQEAHRRGRVTQSGTAPTLVTVREAAAGLRVGPSTVYSLCTAAQLPHVRISHLVRIESEDVEALPRRRGS